MGDDYIILLYEHNIVQVLKRDTGIVYWENVPVEELKAGLDFPEVYCPVVLFQGELWHMISRQMYKPLGDYGGNYSAAKPVMYKGIIAAALHERKSIAIYNESGQLLVKKEVCVKKQPEMLSDEKLDLPPGKSVSELLRKHISKSLDQEIYECNTYAFIDVENLFIGCTKGYLRLWEIKNNVLSEIDSIHKKDITSMQIYQQCHSILQRTVTVSLCYGNTGKNRIKSLSYQFPLSIHKNQILCYSYCRKLESRFSAMIQEN